MKKNALLFALFLALLLNLTNLSPVFAAGATLSLSPSSGTFNTGCSFSADIKLDTAGTQTDGTDSIIFYDPTRFAATSVQSGTIYSDYPGNIIDAQGGKVTVSGLASVSSPFAGSGTLATINFTVLDNAPTGVTKIKFDFDPSDKTKTTDSNVVERGTVADVLSQVNDGSYTIGSGSCSVTPTPGGGGSGGGRGGPGSIATPSATPLPTKPPVLEKAADIQPTFVLALVGGALTLFGILGAAFL